LKLAETEVLMIDEIGISPQTNWLVY